MRKIIFLLVFSAAASAQVSNPSIVVVSSAPSGSCTSGLPNQQVSTTGVQYSCQNRTWGAIGGGGGGAALATGLWTRRGPVVYPFGTFPYTAMEPSVMVDTSPVLLTQYTTVFKMWFNYDAAVCYAESPDGINNWTVYTGCLPSGISGHAEPNVIKNGSTYYLFTHNNSANNLDLYTSTDGVNFTLLAAAIIGNQASNTGGVFIGGTLYLFVEGPGSPGASTVLYTSTTPYTSYTLVGQLATYVKGPSNPVQVGSKWWMWGHTDLASGSYCGTFTASCSAIIRLSAPAITGPWTNSETANNGFDLWPQVWDEEGGTLVPGQAADPFTVELNGKTYLYYTATYSDAVRQYQEVKLATADMPISSVVQTAGGPSVNTLDNQNPFGLQMNISTHTLSFNTLNLTSIQNLTATGNLAIGGIANTFSAYTNTAAALTLEGNGAQGASPTFNSCDFSSANCTSFFLDFYGKGTTGTNGTVGHGNHIRGGRNLSGYDSTWFDTLAGVTYFGLVNKNYPTANMAVASFDHNHYALFGSFAAYYASTAVASAATITPTSQFFHVTGTTAIDTITAPTACTNAGTMCQITIIPDGIFTTTTAGNIALASTAVVSKALIMTYDPGATKWFPSY